MSVRELARLLGNMVAAHPAILPAPLHYRNVERAKSTALRQGHPYCNSNFKCSICSFSSDIFCSLASQFLQAQSQCLICFFFKHNSRFFTSKNMQLLSFLPGQPCRYITPAHTASSHQILKLLQYAATD